MKWADPRSRVETCHRPSNFIFPPAGTKSEAPRRRSEPAYVEGLIPDDCVQHLELDAQLGNVGTTASLARNSALVEKPSLDRFCRESDYFAKVLVENVSCGQEFIKTPGRIEHKHAFFSRHGVALNLGKVISTPVSRVRRRDNNGACLYRLPRVLQESIVRPGSTTKRLTCRRGQVLVQVWPWSFLNERYTHTKHCR
jgi:hypothetical protein